MEGAAGCINFQSASPGAPEKAADNQKKTEKSTSIIIPKTGLHRKDFPHFLFIMYGLFLAEIVEREKERYKI